MTYESTSASKWATEELTRLLNKAEVSAYAGRAKEVVEFWKFCKERGYTVIVVKKGE